MAEYNGILVPRLMWTFCLYVCFHLVTFGGLAAGYRSGDVRLIGGYDRYEGTVLVYSRGRWKTICGLGWDVHDARVVCKQLGFRGLRRYFRWSKFGEGSSTKLTVEFRCRGNERNLLRCPRIIRRNPSLKNACYKHHVSAGLVCKSSRVTTTTTRRTPATTRTTPTTTRTTPTTTRTTPTTTRTTPIPTTTTSTTALPTSSPTTSVSQRKTTVYILNATHHSVDKNNKIISGALAANRSMPEFRKNSELKEENSPQDDGSIMKDEHVIVAGNTGGSLSSNTDIKQLHNQLPSAGSSDSDRNSVPVKKEKPKKKKKRKKAEDIRNSSKKAGTAEVVKESSVDQSKDHQEKETFKIALRGGRYNKEGRVAVMLTGSKKWGVICGDHWSYFESKVVCKELGYGLVKQVYNLDYYGGSDADKLFARIRCHGNETRLSHCALHEYYNRVKCSKQVSVAAVICTDELPDLVPDAEALRASIRLEDRPLYYLQCAMEENCLSEEAYDIKENSQDWITASRRLLRFSSIVHNKGKADFIPNTPKDSWEWHQCHMHYHSMEIFAHYDIMDLKGNRVAQGHKASFCLEDTRCPHPITPKYNCLGYGDQGLSVNCSDNYYHDIDCQWIDITGLKFGNYILQVEFNPNMHVSEESFDNNVVWCRLYYTGTYAQANDCKIIPLLRKD